MTLDLAPLVTPASVVAACVSAAAALGGLAWTVGSWASRLSSQVAVFGTDLHNDRKAAQERGGRVATELAGINKSLADIRDDVVATREAQAAGEAERGALAARVTTCEDRHDSCSCCGSR